jgi:diaminopimelate epimerase
MAVNSWRDIAPARGRAFLKMHGLRNHFVIVDGRDKTFSPTPAQSVLICDAGAGVGADQLLVLEPPTSAGAAGGADVFMRIINIDGADVGACGNATRCVAWLMMQESGRDEVTVETTAGRLKCQRAGDMLVRVEMGRISTKWDAIALSRAANTYHLGLGSGPLQDGMALNIGNPHAVFFVDDLDAVDMIAFAPAIQNDALFPQKVNVGAAQMLDEGRIRLSVYERPGILTAACGSGACVAARAAQLRGLTARKEITVEMVAGSVEIELLDNGGAIMSGPVGFCFSGHLPVFDGDQA